MLTIRGISYLVGEASTDDVRRDLEVIAARTAFEIGLGVYNRPTLSELPQPKVLEHLDAVAEAAEELPWRSCHARGDDQRTAR